MEVHAHTHTERKKWTHYLWEFLMLFLAVFCGFLAENQREHMIEHQREKKYIVSLIKDVELDIASLENSVALRKIQLSYFDSLTTILKQGYKKSDERFLLLCSSYSQINTFSISRSDNSAVKKFGKSSPDKKY